MIYCVAFDDVHRHLENLGYVFREQTERTLIYAHSTTGEPFTVRRPNVDGHVPEVLVNDAFDNAGLPMPKWDVFWCD